MPGLLDQFQIFDRPVFRDSQKVLINEKCCIYDNPNRLKNISSEYLHLTGQFYQYFDGNLPEIQSFVKPSGDFGPLPKSEIDNFLTCIHIRRTDFVDGEHHSSDLNFTRSAMNYILEKEKPKNRRMMTVIMGDDPSFEASIFENSWRKGSEIKNTTKYFVSENTPYDDLAYSRYHCDTVLITAPSSTFGWWLGYLSKGNSVYYQDIRSTNDVNYKKGILNPNDFFPTHWKAIKLDGDGKIVVVEPI
ncbi:hypothetical protein B9Z55_009733 [Caenorhabditis nigoni]|uniref:L-Fucosyltransferase n=1 Tax=Caenorhabditis nigoni TaxID=1611254 RepID=A0A2G5UTG8_9PELO|nr:hypothetical protein B9Z55_009733 [Caenorhabditis nigoni]